jgi:hypothetical protein
MTLILMKYPKNLIKNRLELNLYFIIKLAQYIKDKIIS